MNVVLIVIFSVFCRHVLPQTCSPFKVDRNHIGMQLEGYLITDLPADSISDCAKQCFFQTHCKSFNFGKSMTLCQLSSADSVTASAGLVVNQTFIYSDISSWPSSMAGVCGNRPCSGKQLCLPGQEPSCVSTDCPAPPAVDDAVVTPGSVDVASERVYTCPSSEHILADADTINIPATDTIKCQRLAGWSPVQFVCRRPASCSEVKKCSATYTQDDHYWLYPVTLAGEKVKVYCHQMQSSEPTEYISVNTDTNDAFDRGNNGEATGSKMNFEKIRLDIQTMIVLREDTTFSSSSGSNPPDAYGKGADCNCDPTCSPRKGYFHIDTTGTGLIVDPTLTWIAEGWQPSIENFVRSNDYRTITAYCGGLCGFCVPTRDMVLQFNAPESVQDNEAIFPACD